MSANASRMLHEAHAHLSKAILEVKQAQRAVFEVRGLHAVHVALGLLVRLLINDQQTVAELFHTPGLRTHSETPEEGP